MKLLSCLLLLLAPVCMGQTFTFNQGGTTAKGYYQEIPYENINGKIFIEGEISGKKHRFLFDTGAPVAVSKALAAELGIKTMTKISIGDVFLNKDSTAIVEVNDLKLGNLKFDHIPAITLFPDFYQCYHIDGVIGSNLLRNSIIRIDNNKHIITFTDEKGKLNLKPKNGLPLISNVGMQSDPKIRVLMKGVLNLTIAFDTGDNSFFRLDDKMVGDLRRFSLFDTLAKGYGASSYSEMGLQKSTGKFLLKVAPFTIGTAQFNNVVAESNQKAIPAIGSKLLEYGTVTLDYINSKFYFDANEAVTDAGEKQWPCKPTFANGKLIVGVVWQTAAPELKQGEQILALDGIDYSNTTLCDLINNKPILYGKETAVLTIKDAGGNIKKVTIKKE